MLNTLINVPFQEKFHTCRTSIFLINLNANSESDCRQNGPYVFSTPLHPYDLCRN